MDTDLNYADFRLADGESVGRNTWCTRTRLLVSVVAGVAAYFIIVLAVSTGAPNGPPKALFGLGNVEFDIGSVPFSYFSVMGVTIVIVDDVLKYYQETGGRNAGQSSGYGCPDTTACLHGQSDRSARITNSGYVVFDIPVYQYEIEVFRNRTFTMTMTSGENYTSDNGNVFLINTLNQYSVQQLFVDFDRVKTEDGDILESVIRDVLVNTEAVYEFAVGAIEENAQWDENNDYINRLL